MNGDLKRFGKGMVTTPATYCALPAVTFERSLDSPDARYVDSPWY